MAGSSMQSTLMALCVKPPKWIGLSLMTKISLCQILVRHLQFNTDIYSSRLPIVLHAHPQHQHDSACMAELIAQEQRASNDQGNSFKKQPWRQQTQKKRQQSTQLSVSAALSLVGDNFFGSLSAEEYLHGSAQGNEEYTRVESDSSSSESGSDSDEVEITNKEVSVIIPSTIEFSN